MKATLISACMALVLIGGAFALSRAGAPQADILPGSNVSIEDGKQVITIKAKGGYLPRKTTAKAGIPTVIRFDTSGTFDCSASVSIPSLGVREILPQSGSTDIDVGGGDLGVLKGSCGMGMYPFEIEFQS